MQDFFSRPSTNNETISVFAVVRRLREQRWSMVRKECQYEFIYSYLLSRQQNV